MDSKNIEIIKTTVQELIEKIGFTPEVKIIQETEGDAENIICDVSISQDSNILIGQYEINLQALQHIARLLVRKKTEDRIKFVLDVNSYRQQKNESVAELAREASKQAMTEGRAVMMRPMSAYERRLVHMELSGNKEVVTESIGEGESRKVVVKPAELV